MTITTPAIPNTGERPSRIAPRNENAHSILVFAPSDASSDYLEFRQATDGLYEQLEERGIEVLELFETMNIPARDQVGDPDVSEALRKRYAIPDGKMSLLVTTDVGERPTLRIEGDVTRSGILDRIDSLGRES